MLVERKVCYSALFTNLVRWHARVASFPPRDIILAQQVGGSGLSPSPKVGLGLGLLLNNEQARARMGLGFGPSLADPNLGS